MKCIKCKKRPVMLKDTYCNSCISGLSIEDPTYIKVRNFITGVLIVAGIIYLIFGGFIR